MSPFSSPVALDPDDLRLLHDEPELLAIADAFRETQQAQLLGVSPSDPLRRPGRPRQRRALVLAVALALTTIAVVTPAFGLGSRMLDLFEGTPAPPEVQEMFVEWNRTSMGWGAASNHMSPERVASAQAWLARMYPRVDPSQAHGVVAVELSPAVVLQLWAAPISGGGECSIVLRPDQGNNLMRGTWPFWAPKPLCVTPTTPVSPRATETLWTGVPGRGVIAGIAPGAASVEIRFADGGSVQAPVVAGFFLAPVTNPALRIAPGSTPETMRHPDPAVSAPPPHVISYDTGGDQLAETRSLDQVIADYLGITVADLWAERPTTNVNKDGKTYSDLATDRAKSVSGLVDALLANDKVALDAQVAGGQITAAEQTSRLADLQRNRDGMVHGLPPGFYATRPGSQG